MKHSINANIFAITLICNLKRELNLELSRIKGTNKDILIYDNMETIPLKHDLIINYLN